MGLMDRFKTKIPGQVAAPKAADDSATPKTKKVAKTKVEKTAEPKVSSVPKSKAAYRIIIRPLVTEKAAIMQSANKYVFVVAANANKFQIAQAVKELYGVKALSINVANVEGKSVRFGRGMGRRSDLKKAIITVPAGSNISIHEGV